MRSLAEHHMKPTDRLDDLFRSDFHTWHKVIQELRDHNARLAEIISDLLIKNQHLRVSLEPRAKTSGLSAATDIPRE